MSKDTERKLLEITRIILRDSIGNEKLDDINVAEEDINALCELSQKHKIDSIIVNVLHRKYPANEELALLKEQIDKKIAVFLSELKTLVDILDENGIDYRLIKGFPFSKLVYGDYSVRRCADLDIIIKEENIDEAFRLFRSLGYEQFDNEGAEEYVYAYSFDFHEIEMYKNVGDVEVWTEIKRSSSAITSPSYDWFSNVEYDTLGTYTVKTQDNINAILHAFVNAFINNEDKYIYQSNFLRDYFDIAYFIKNHRIDWECLLKEADKICSSHKIFEVIRSIKELYPEIDTADIDKYVERQMPYKPGLAYMRECDPDKYNSQLVSGKIRVPADYSIFDTNFKSYEFARKYKTALFSLKNDCFVNRRILSADQVWKNYKSEIIKEKISFSLTWNDGLFVIYRIRKESLQYFTENKVIPKFDWISCDFDSPELFFSLVGKPFVQEKTTGRITADVWDLYTDDFKAENKGNFHKEITVQVSSFFDDEYIYERFEIDKSDVLASLPYIYTEVIACLKYSDVLMMDTEINKEMIEISI